MGLYFKRNMLCMPTQWAYPEMHGLTKKDLKVRKMLEINIYGFIPLNGNTPIFVVANANPNLTNGWSCCKESQINPTKEEIDAVRRSY